MSPLGDLFAGLDWAVPAVDNVKAERIFIWFSTKIVLSPVKQIGISPSPVPEVWRIDAAGDKITQFGRRLGFVLGVGQSQPGFPGWF